MIRFSSFQPRCAPLPDTIEMGCTIAPDPFDDCCSMVSCNKNQGKNYFLLRLKQKCPYIYN